MKRRLSMLRVSQFLLSTIIFFCLFASLITPVAAVANDLGPVTKVHRAGVCAMRGQV